jgi:uncharacterized membrane protein
LAVFGTLRHEIEAGESRMRSAVKMLMYRALVTVLLAVISWYFTGNVGLTAIIAIVYAVGATAIYYLHERMWNQINWGLRRRQL